MDKGQSSQQQQHDYGMCKARQNENTRDGQILCDYYKYSVDFYLLGVLLNMVPKMCEFKNKTIKIK